MEKKKLSLSRRLSLGAMVAALTLLFLYASEVLTGFRFLCAALSGFFIALKMYRKVIDNCDAIIQQIEE